jgi:gluconolactonase
MRVDVHGKLSCAGSEAEDEVAVFAPDGELIGRIMLPGCRTNLCLGGVDRDRLFIEPQRAVGG